MEYVLLFMFFIYGLVFGSFFNVVGLRVPKGESIVKPPSHCTVCDRNLTINRFSASVFLCVFKREM